MVTMNCGSSLFTFSDTITRGHKLSVRTRQCKTSIRRNYFMVQVTNLWNSLPGYVVESPSVNSFKNRLDKYCQSKGIMFSIMILTLWTSTLCQSYQSLIRFNMIATTQCFFIWFGLICLFLFLLLNIYLLSINLVCQFLLVFFLCWEEK